MDVEKILKELTLEEKIALLQGTNFMYTNPVPRLNIKSIRFSDGPHGLRVQIGSGDNGISTSEIATCFPTSACSASSFDEELLYKEGQAIGEEANNYGVNIVLGPGVCIKRNPLCGRNFEYFSEDPLLSGKLGAALTRGIESKGVGVSLKHFALNNAENYRFMGNSIADERAIREIYLKSFETIVKEAKPTTLMCAYNMINGTYCSENKWLLIDVLRKEWGFDGLVMSDWGATHSRVDGVKAQLDLEMPGDTAICRKWLFDAVNENKLTLEELNTSVRNVLNVVNKFENSKIEKANFEDHNKLAQKVAEESAVLLKNEGVLPLKEDEEVVVIGDMFLKMRYQGSGSSMINPYKVTSPKNAFDSNGIKYSYAQGYKENGMEDEALLKEAVELAKKDKKVLLFIGLTDFVESEGCDRENMKLSSNQLKVIDEVLKVNKDVIVVMYGGSQFELPFIDKVKGALLMYLPGQNGGNATYNLLFGKVSPSGRLPETWVKRYEDVPYNEVFSKGINEIYKESIFVGYRYYITKNKEVNFPFGYGLSYQTYSYKNLKVEDKGEKITISVEVKNESCKEGKEVVLLFIRGPKGVFKPYRELKGFKKVTLNSNESKEVSFDIAKDDLKFFNIKDKRYVLEGGEYVFEICKDASTSILEEKLFLEGEEFTYPYSKDIDELYKGNIEDIKDEEFEEMSNVKIPSLPLVKPITMESRFSNLQQSTFMGKILFKAVLSVSSKAVKEAKKMEEGPEKDNKIKGALFLKRILESNSLITMSMSAGNSCPYNFAEAMMLMSNGHIIKGLVTMMRKIKCPKLPKEEK